MNLGWLAEIRFRYDLWMAEWHALRAIKHRRRCGERFPLILEPNDLVTRMRKGEDQ